MATSVKRVKLSNRFNEPWDNSDIILSVEDVKFHCHSLLLKLNSPVFEAMFSEHFVEGRERSVELPGKDLDSFAVFLSLLYPLPDTFVLTNDRVILQKVLDYCDEYQVEAVKKIIDNTLALNLYGNGVKSVATAMEDILLAETYGLEETKKYCFKFLISNSQCTSYKETVYKRLSKESKYDLIVGKLKKLQQLQIASQQIQSPVQQPSILAVQQQFPKFGTNIMNNKDFTLLLSLPAEDNR